MRKLLSVALVALLAAPPLIGQLRQQTSATVQNVNQHVVVATITGNVTRTFAINNGATRHQVTFKSAPSVTAVTVTVNATANDSTYSQVGTSTLLNDTITFYCVCTGANIITTGYTGSGAIEVDYYGDTPTSQTVGLTAAPFNTAIGAVADALKVNISGDADQGAPGTLPWPVTETVSSAITEYTGTGATVVVLSATSGTSWTTNTIYIQSLRCHNITAGAITVNRTDTAGTQFEVSYSIPANSNYYLESPGSWTKMVGLKIWASAVASLDCIMTAKQ